MARRARALEDGLPRTRGCHPSSPLSRKASGGERDPEKRAADRQSDCAFTPHRALARVVASRWIRVPSWPKLLFRASCASFVPESYASPHRPSKKTTTPAGAPKTSTLVSQSPGGFTIHGPFRRFPARRGDFEFLVRGFEKRITCCRLRFSGFSLEFLRCPQ